MQDYNIRLKYADEVWNKIISSQIYAFSSVTPSQLPQNAGVYIIWLKDTQEVLYVGRTKKIRQRIKQHLDGNEASARLKKYLVDDKELTDIVSYDDARQYMKDNCCFQYILVEDDDERGRIEGLFEFMAMVRYIQKEH